MYLISGLISLLLLLLLQFLRPGIEQWLYWLATGWTTEGSEFESRNGKDFSPLHVVQTGSGANLAFHRKDIWLLSLAAKRQGREANHSPPNQCRGEECVDLYFHSPLRLRGVEPNQLSTWTILPPSFNLIHILMHRSGTHPAEVCTSFLNYFCSRVHYTNGYSLKQFKLHT
jgi:hypothetical protein